MSDASLRVASRLLAADYTDVQTRAAVIAGLVRTGRLDRRRVALASYLGDAAALLVEPAPPQFPSYAREWSLARRVLQCGGLSHVASARLAADCAERVIQFAGEHRGVCEAAIEAARAWASCPCEEHRLAAKSAARSADAAVAAEWVADAAAREADAAVAAGTESAAAADTARAAEWVADAAAWAAAVAAVAAATDAATDATEWVAAAAEAAWSAARAAVMPRDEDQWQADHIAAHLLGSGNTDRRTPMSEAHLPEVPEADSGRED